MVQLPPLLLLNCPYSTVDFLAVCFSDCKQYATLFNPVNLTGLNNVQYKKDK